jgi:UDP-N-acetyl-D-glucosamine dehydrogenase
VSGKGKAGPLEAGRGKYSPPANPERVTLEALSEGTRVFSRENISQLRGATFPEVSGHFGGVLMKELIQKIESRRAIVGIIGLGYVGLPLMVRFAEERFNVLGFDIDSQKVDLLNDGKSYIRSVPRDQIRDLVRRGIFAATSDYTRLPEVDCILICVPTPLTEKMEPDLVYIENTAHQVTENMKRGQLIVLESTTYPGTTEEILLPKFQARGWREGVDFFLAYSPEREDPGNREYTTKSIPKVVAGITQNCRKVAKLLYQQVIDEVVVVSSTRAAEMTKLLENIYRSVNIALVNELKILADRMGIDILWLFPLLPGAGNGRPLHSHRPLLPLLEGQGIRLYHPVH